MGMNLFGINKRNEEPNRVMPIVNIMIEGVTNPSVNWEPNETITSVTKSVTARGTSDALFAPVSMTSANASGIFDWAILPATRKNPPVIDRAIPGHRNIPARFGK